MRAFLILLILPVSALAWTDEDSKWEAAFVAATIVDWGQTRGMVRQPCWKDYHEANPIIGKHPTSGKVDRYFTAFIIGHAIISYTLPEEYRRKWQILTFASQVAIIAHNHHIGLRVDF